MRARELMSSPVVTVLPEANLKDVAELMATHRISGLPVVDRFGTLVGIISEWISSHGWSTPVRAKALAASWAV